MQVQPAGGVDQDIDDAGRRQPVGDRAVHCGDGLGHLCALQALEHQPPVEHAGVQVVREPSVHGIGQCRQFGAQTLHEVSRVGGDARDLAVGVQFLRECRLVDQLLAVVVVTLAVRDVQVAGFEFVLDLREHRQFEVLAMDPAGAGGGQGFGHHMLAPG